MYIYLYCDGIAAVVLYGDGERRASERGAVGYDGAGLRVQTLDLLHIGPHQTEQTAETSPLRAAGTTRRGYTVNVRGPTGTGAVSSQNSRIAW